MRLTFTCWIIVFTFFSQNIQGQSIVEGFDNVPVIYQSDWVQKNLSNPLGPALWKQDYGNFTAYSGPDSSSIVCSFESTDPDGAGTISNWLITPVLTMNAGDTLWFRTISFRNNVYPDRLQVRLSTSGSSIDVGITESSIGVFDSLLLDINPNLTLSGYSMSWKQYGIPIPVSMPNTQGRIAFRYYVTDGGGTGNNSSAVGIDDFFYSSITDVGVQEIESTIVIYPNPAATRVRIQSTQTSVDRLEVITPTGQSRLYTINAIDYELDVKGWPKGIYLLKVYWESVNEPSIHKLIVY